MNTFLIELAKFTRDLLSIPESKIKIGRKNFKRTDFKSLQLVIDQISPSSQLSRNRDYDGSDGVESMQYSVFYQAPCTIDFYGDTAFSTAQTFILSLNTQLSYELQRDMQLTVYQASNLIDVALLTGEQYSERYQLELNIQLTLTHDVDTKRIDEAQTELYFNL